MIWSTISIQTTGRGWKTFSNKRSGGFETFNIYVWYGVWYIFGTLLLRHDWKVFKIVLLKGIVVDVFTRLTWERSKRLCLQGSRTSDGSESGVFVQAMIREYSLIIWSRRSDILLKDIQNSFRCCFTKLERIRSKLTLYFFLILSYLFSSRNRCTHGVRSVDC